MMLQTSGPLTVADNRRLNWLVAASVGNVLLFLFAIVLVAYTIQRSSAGMGLFGAAVGALSIVQLISALLEMRLLRRRPGAALGRAPDGLPALVVPRMEWTVAIAAATTAVLGLFVAAGGALALNREHWIFGILLVVVGLCLLSFLVPLAAGQIKPGGLSFTAEGIDYRADAAWWRVAWTDVESAALQGSLVAIVLTENADVVRGSTTRWGWQRTVRSPDQTLGVQTRGLAEDGAMLTFIISQYVLHPELRAALGTPASLEWDILDHW